MKFLIVDDHPMLRDGVAAVLHQFDADSKVLQAAEREQGLCVLGSTSSHRARENQDTAPTPRR
jgi:DNA-binding NarL/FixJ family response regulator